MTTDDFKPVTLSRRIETSAHEIFHVVEFEPDRRIGWEPEAGRGCRT